MWRRHPLYSCTDGTVTWGNAPIAARVFCCSVHERNHDALIGMALVYHETHQFVRLVQIMPLDDTIWQFLAPMQRSGAPLPRATLVQRCISDQVGAGRHVKLLVLVIHLIWPQALDMISCA
jgi:hypothetical protein